MRTLHDNGLRNRSEGFTLIEVMIAVAIIGIIAMIGYPTYQEYIVKSHRAKAKACVMEHAQAMERHYTTNLTYVGGNPVLACRNDGSLNTRYQIAIANVDARTYTVSATPVGAQIEDTQCGALSLDQAGMKTVTGEGHAAQCW